MMYFLHLLISMLHAGRLFSFGYCRFCTTGLPSDVTVEVGEMSFHLHKVIVS